MRLYTSKLLLGAGLALICFFGKPASAEEPALSTEVRVGLFAPSFRWSNRLPDSEIFIDNAERSLYFSPSLGARFYPRGGHGATIDFDYRLDSDTDSVCIIFTEFCPASFRIDFTTVHIGYAYRHIVESPKAPYRRAWAFTPHVSFATGAALAEVSAGGVRRSSPVVGGRAGFDIDLHLERFFLGWSFSYEILAHTRGAIRYSHFFSWNAIPVFRMGGVIGRRVQTEPPEFIEVPRP